MSCHPSSCALGSHSVSSYPFPVLSLSSSVCRADPWDVLMLTFNICLDGVRIKNSLRVLGCSCATFAPSNTASLTVQHASSVFPDTSSFMCPVGFPHASYIPACFPYTSCVLPLCCLLLRLIPRRAKTEHYCLGISS